MRYLLCLIGILMAPALAAAAPVVEFHDAERIIFLGNEFFDREQDQCYIETLLTTRFPDKDLTFRNLGYAGDTVWADARTLCSGWDQFGPPDQGFERLTKLVGEIKPTLIFVAYGMNESFDGPAGLDHFRQGLDRMLAMLAKTGARIVLVSPIPHERIDPLPDPAEHNKNLALYSASMQEAAKRSGAVFLDVLGAMAQEQHRPGDVAMTSDGIHFTPSGYRQVASLLERRMGFPPRAWGINIDAATGNFGATGITTKDPSHAADHVSFTGIAEMLPVLLAVSPDAARTIQVRNLSPGMYALKIDGTVVASGPAEDWARGMPLLSGPDDDQAESLRKLIVEKNFDFFNYWRPQNDTYIFGYRKHEQGRNAVEVPRFKETIPAKETEIARLRQPVPHKYVLAKENDN